MVGNQVNEVALKYMADNNSVKHTKRYKAYPEYKDSGVKWLGDIPIGWKVKRLKYLSSINTGDKDTVNAIEDGKYPFFVRSQTVERINSFTADCEAVLTAGDGVGVGKVYHYINGKFDYHQRVYMLSDFNKITGRFLYYYLSSNFYKVALQGNAKSTVDSLRLPQFLNFEFSLPPLDTQPIIVNFLDHETAKIDTLIEKQQRLIELLTEKRQAVISHAVTKGLNPNVPMKDSGVEWLGQVPKHWEVVKGGYIGQLFGSESISEDKVIEDGEVAFIKVSTLTTEGFEISKPEWFVDRKIDKYITKRSGYIVFPKRGAAIYTNKVNIVYTPSIIDPNLMGWILNKNAINEFIALVLKTRRLDDIADVSTVPQINNKHINPEKFPLPPIEEQRKIVNYLVKETSAFKKLINLSHQQIQLMQERRTALISAAVTGKIDVRDWGEPE